MSNKLVKCKSCGREIAKNAKVCPSCGAKQRRGGVATAVVSIFAVIAVIGAISVAIGGNGTNLTSGGDGLSPEASGIQAVGDEKSVGLNGTVKGDHFDLSIVDVKCTDALENLIGTITTTVTPEGKDKTLLCVTFSAKNTTDSTQNVANAGFNAYADGKKVLPKAVSGKIDDAMPFVGAVSSGMEMVGYSVWELPKDWQEFKTSYIDAGTGVESKQHFVIHREDIN